jgi:4'-phosphopantetheinyl transferase
MLGEAFFDVNGIAIRWSHQVESLFLGLALNEVLVWCADLRQHYKWIPYLTELLSAEEIDRAKRCNFPKHQERFITGWGLLRVILSVCLNQPAAKLSFDRGLHGKPFLTGPELPFKLYFNLSHSGDNVLYAISRREVGVDLESHNRNAKLAELSERICTSRELAQLWEQPCALRRESFFDCWTRKEAILKAIGVGLSGGLDKLEVCFKGEKQQEYRIQIEDIDGRAWTILNLPLEASWSGALAAAGTNWQWRGWKLRDYSLY